MAADASADVIVVGSGAGGGAAAWALSRHGLRVLVLEAGPAFDAATDYRLDANDWERHGFPEKPGSRGRHGWAEGQPLDARWSHLRTWNRQTGAAVTGARRMFGAYQHVRGVGGSTLHFTGEAHRLHPRAMRMRSDFGVAADWPFGYDALEPWWLQAERIVGVAGAGADVHRPRSAPHPLPAHPSSFASRKLGEGVRSKGLTWTPNSLAVLSRPQDGRLACNWCGQCQRGCPRADKGSVDVTFLRQARATGRCEVRALCRVTRVETGPGDRVTGVVWRDASGATRRAPARAMIVACGAVETPRLLLLSGPGGAREGLANESGLVGRNFMETLAWTSVGMHPDPIGSHRGLPSDSICWDFNAPDAIPGVVGGCRFSPATLEAGLAGPIHYASRVIGGWGRAHKRAMRERFGHALAIGAIGESLPNPGSYVDLDPTLRDDDGAPLARIHSVLPETELRRLDFMARTAREILKAAGAGELVEEYGTWDTFNATHVFGTCRMGTDPRTSVVDPFGASHRWRNLFVCDASVFPSSGGGESPSLTIEALALRSAEHLAERMRRGAL